MATSNDNSLKPVVDAFARWLGHTQPVVAVKAAMRRVWKWSIQVRLHGSMRKFIRAHDKYVNRRERLKALRQYQGSPESVAEALDLARFWALVRRALIEDDPDPPDGPGSKIVDLSERLNTVTKQRLAAQEQERIQREQALRRRSWKIVAGTAASLLFAPSAVVVNGIWFGRSVETKRGDWRRLRLSDGTVVILQPHTQIDIRFNDNQRFVRVPQGAAYFEVAKDVELARPFVVDAVRADIRALGTAFEVRHQNRRVIVTTREGKVQVTRKLGSDSDLLPGGRAGEGVPVSEGQQVAVSALEPVIAKRINPEIELAWTRGHIAFEPGATLADVVAESNRLNVVQIVITDPEFGSRRARGIYAANDPRTLAKQLALQAAATVVHDESGVLRIEGAAVLRSVQ